MVIGGEAHHFLVKDTEKLLSYLCSVKHQRIEFSSIHFHPQLWRSPDMSEFAWWLLIGLMFGQEFWSLSKFASSIQTREHRDAFSRILVSPQPWKGMQPGPVKVQHEPACDEFTLPYRRWRVRSHKQQNFLRSTFCKPGYVRTRSVLTLQVLLSKLLTVFALWHWKQWNLFVFCIVLRILAHVFWGASTTARQCFLAMLKKCSKPL